MSRDSEQFYGSFEDVSMVFQGSFMGAFKSFVMLLLNGSRRSYRLPKYKEVLLCKNQFLRRMSLKVWSCESLSLSVSHSVTLFVADLRSF